MDEIRIIRKPGNQAFPVANTMALNQNYNMHNKCIKNYENLADTAKPKYFSIDMKYMDGRPILYN